MSTDNRAAETPIKLQKEQIFGEKGFGIEYFEPEVLAEAIVAVVKKIDFDHLRGFTNMREVFRKSPNHYVSSSAIDEALEAAVIDRDSKTMLSLGEWEVRLGLIPRSAGINPPIGDEDAWVRESTWIERVLKTGARASVLPMQVSSRMTQVGVLSRSKRLYTGSIAWECVLKPSFATPEEYDLYSLQFDEAIDLTDVNEVDNFVRTEGKAAALVVLTGLNSSLHNSNRQVEAELSQNQSAKMFVEKIITRVRG